MTDYENLEEIVAAARACRVCEKHLVLGPRPVLRAAGWRLPHDHRTGAGHAGP